MSSTGSALLCYECVACALCTFFHSHTDRVLLSAKHTPHMVRPGWGVLGTVPSPRVCLLNDCWVIKLNINQCSGEKYTQTHPPSHFLQLVGKSCRMRKRGWHLERWSRPTAPHLSCFFHFYFKPNVVLDMNCFFAPKADVYCPCVWLCQLMWCSWIQDLFV